MQLNESGYDDGMRRAPSVVILLATVACGARSIPAGSPDQSVADAMRLVCAAPARADADRGAGSYSDKVAGHLSDGVGNARVLQTIETWKTDGIDKTELRALLAEAKLDTCALEKETP
jgi:hypothetical protein